MTPDAGAQPGERSPADGSGPRELLRYRSAQGRWVVAAMILRSSVAGIDSTVVAVALPAIGRNLHAGFQALQWTVTAYTVTLASLMAQIGMVTQETHLFHDTIRTNLLYAKLDATQSEIEAAARAANIHNFVIGLPDGYDTVVGERGYRLSGGENRKERKHTVSAEHDFPRGSSLSYVGALLMM